MESSAAGPGPAAFLLAETRTGLRLERETMGNAKKAALIALMAAAEEGEIGRAHV